MNAPHYYNEFDPKAAAWLRELMRAGLIPAGHVDTRSIADVQPADLAGFVQCHFFAGIGGWPLALRLAGWPEDVPVWTGSCPCQPFSCAGKGLGTKDPRHLWPEFRRLIAECHPATVFGEQVASRAGREWLAGVFADLEGMAYAVAGADLCAAGVAAPHIRQRLYWVADAADTVNAGGGRTKGRSRSDAQRKFGASRSIGRLADAECDGGRADQPGREAQGRVADGRSGRLGDADINQFRTQVRPKTRNGAKARRMREPDRSSSAWSAFDLLPCRDGKTRRIESGTFPLADGVPARVVRLRGYGNAIVPQVAAVFIRAACESIVELSP